MELTFMYFLMAYSRYFNKLQVAFVMSIVGILMSYNIFFLSVNHS